VKNGHHAIFVFYDTLVKSIVSVARKPDAAIGNSNKPVVVIVIDKILRLARSFGEISKKNKTGVNAVLSTMHLQRTSK